MLSLIFGKLIILADTSWYRHSLCNGFCFSYREAQQFERKKDSDFVASKVLREDHNAKDTILLLQLAMLTIGIVNTAHSNADYNSFSFFSELKGKDTRAQYQLMIFVLQLLFLNAFTGRDTISRIFDVELVKKEIFQVLVESDQILLLCSFIILHYNMLLEDIFSSAQLRH